MTEYPEVMSYILQRRSVRSFLDQPVEVEKLELLLRAAMSAPTACNSQPWEFVVITEREVLDKLRDKLMFARYNAPAAIVVCGNLKIANSSAAKYFWVHDCSAAMENILIAAAGLGLGAVWIGVHPLPTVIRPVSQILGIPEEVTPLGMAYVGYPTETPPPHTRRYDDYRVYWQHYELRKRRAKKKNAKHDDD